MWWHKRRLSYREREEKTTRCNAPDLKFSINFPTRTQGSSCTAIDNIFLDTNTFFKYTISPQYNGLADHDAQLLIINDLNLQPHNHCTHTIRSSNTYTVEEFKTKMSYESLDNDFSHNENTNVDTVFNSLLDYLRIF